MRTGVVVLLASLALAGCAGTRGPGGHDGYGGHGADRPASGGMTGGGMMGGGGGAMGGGMMGMKGMAFATLTPTRDQAVSGIVVFHDHGEQVMVHARISGLRPNAEHGFHIHEKGDCASPDAMTAGGHYNPSGKPHGPPDAEHHAGDMPSLKSDANGVADARFMLRGVSVGGSAADVSGRSVIVHAQPDDYRTQPTGNSGARLACGVIARAPHGQ